MAEECPTDLLKTPLNEEHRRLGARMCAFAGYDMPLQYSGQMAEHQAVRTGAGMFDVSHMGQVRFRGPRALEFLQLLVPGNVARLTDGNSLYTQLVTPEGGTVDDLIISRFGEEEYFAVVNGATKDGDIAWMRRQAQALGFADVAIENESDHWAMIAVQGPAALEVLDRLIPGKEWKSTKAFSITPFMANNKAHLLSRTGYTGEIGGELLCPAAHAAEWWRRFLDAGVVPCGLASRDSLRLEMGYALYGNDLDLQTSPIEAGLAWSVSFKKPESFIGRPVLEKQKSEGTARRMVGLMFASRRPMRHDDAVVTEDGIVVGRVASGGYSIMRSVGIGMAYVQSAALDSGAPLLVESRGTRTPATVTKMPFVETSLTKK